MTCPNGHNSVSTDYCDTCGAAMEPTTTMPAVPELEGGPQGPGDAVDGAVNPAAEGASGAPGGPSPGPGQCPNCGGANSPDALFCESCGYDFTTGQLPRREPLDAPAAVAAAAQAGPINTSPETTDTWVAELWIDPAWYANQGSPDPLPSPGPPAVVALRHTSLLVGRRSDSRGIRPDLDCGADNGVSRRHAQLTTDGTRWWVEDLESSNGTYVGEATGELPTKPIPPHAKREIPADGRLYVGSWTRIVIREAAEGELDSA